MNGVAVAESTTGSSPWIAVDRLAATVIVAFWSTENGTVSVVPPYWPWPLKATSSQRDPGATSPRSTSVVPSASAGTVVYPAQSERHVSVPPPGLGSSVTVAVTGPAAIGSGGTVIVIVVASAPR
jgi:hypothetical protein